MSQIVAQKKNTSSSSSKILQNTSYPGYDVSANEFISKFKGQINKDLQGLHTKTPTNLRGEHLSWHFKTLNNFHFRYIVHK